MSTDPKTRGERYRCGWPIMLGSDGDPIRLLRTHGRLEYVTDRDLAATCLAPQKKDITCPPTS